MRVLRPLPLLLLALLGPQAIVCAADAPAAETPDQLPTLEATRDAAVEAVTALFHDDAEGFENALDLSDFSTRYNANFFLRRTRARHTFLLVARAKFGTAAGEADPQPVKAADLDTLEKSLQSAQVWIEENRKQALILPEGPDGHPLHLTREEGDWSFDPECLLPTEKRFEFTQRLRAEAEAYETISQEIADGKLATAAAVNARFTALRFKDDAAPVVKAAETQPAPAAVKPEKSAQFDSPRHAIATYLNAVRTREEAAAKEAVASPDSDEARALEALFLRLASARAIRGAAFDAFGAVALPLDPLDAADDRNLTPAINGASWAPLYFRNGVARMTLSLGSLPLTFIFARSGEDWKIDPAPTLKINKIDPMPETTLSVMRVKAKADFDFAGQIRDKQFATWRAARDARRTAE